MEILLATPAISNLIREGKTFQIPSVMQTSRRMGMVTLNDALLELVEAGRIEATEAYAKAIDKAAIAQALRTRGLDASFVDGETRAREDRKRCPVRLGHQCDRHAARGPRHRRLRSASAWRRQGKAAPDGGRRAVDVQVRSYVRYVLYPRPGGPRPATTRSSSSPRVLSYSSRSLYP